MMCDCYYVLPHLSSFSVTIRCIVYKPLTLLALILDVYILFLFKSYTSCIFYSLLLLMMTLEVDGGSSVWVVCVP